MRPKEVAMPNLSQEQMMVERVARAIAGAQWDRACSALGIPNYPRGGNWSALIPEAQAAIDAIHSTGDDAGLVERALAAYERGEMDAAGTIEALYEHDLSLTARNKALEEALRGLLDAVLAVHEAQGRTVVDPHAIAEASTLLAALNHQDNRQKEGGE
jgi:predicted methyltransferase MtxX (methanogen marker protein 4)